MGLRGYVYGQPDWRRITVAGWLTWGAVGGTTAGELLQVAYAVTHPGVTDATLVLADGRRLAMTVYPDRLELLLPSDTPNGPATVIADLDDGAGTTSTAQLVIFLTGVAVPVAEAKPAGGMPRRALTRPHRLVHATPGRVELVSEPARLIRRAPPALMLGVARTRVRVQLRRGGDGRCAPRWAGARGGAAARPDVTVAARTLGTWRCRRRWSTRRATSSISSRL
jgi:hypothetical protein